MSGFVKPSWQSKPWTWNLPFARVRILSVPAIIGVAGGAAGSVLWPDGALALLSGALRVIGFCLAMVIMIAAPGWRAAKAGEFDERERAERTLALSLSYRAAVVALVSVSIWLNFESTRQLWVPELKEARVLLTGSIWLLVMLPGTIMAWRDHGLEPEE